MSRLQPDMPRVFAPSVCLKQRSASGSAIRQRFAVLLLTGLIYMMPGHQCWSQAAPSSAATQIPDNSQGSLGLGPIALGDAVDVRVFDAPELSVRTRVGASGEIAIPLLGNFRIVDLTAVEAAHAIEELFKERGLLLNPNVIVTVQQFGSGVTVLGQIRNPGIYPVAGKRRIVDFLAMAGGLNEHSGHVIEILSPSDSSPKQTLLWDPTLKRTDNLDLVVEPGQTILVSSCGVIYVGGNVGKPGAYPLCDSLRTTVSQAMALAGGVAPSSKDKAYLVRTDSNGVRTVTFLSIKEILEARAPDIPLGADDIIYVPRSTLKAASKIALQTAIGFATQAYLYIH